jgi:tetratricopeptide (TPR) repeat protein
MQQRLVQLGLGICLLAGAAFGLSGCSTTKAAKAPVSPLASGTCAIALAIHKGEAPLDSEIRGLQGKIKQMANPAAHIERLGWKYIEKARRSYDPGFYKMAEQCALCIDQLNQSQPDDKANYAAALLLRGHVLHNLHRFAEAEPLAREVVAKRGLAYDYALLGDILLEQGRLQEAEQAYQKLMDVKPGLQAYIRAAQLRWLQGDTEGAIEMALLASRAASPTDPEAAAWVTTKLALYDLHYGVLPQAMLASQSAAKAVAYYPAALLVQARILMAQDRASAAIPLLEQATKSNPLPEYQWALIEALHVENRLDEANVVEATLRAKGASEDPRTFALFLATQTTAEPNDAALALKLANEELKNRQDIYSYDALAWAQFRAGQKQAAWTNAQQALASGTQDARLYLHAAAIAQANGLTPQAKRYSLLAHKHQQALLPSERAQLSQLNL